MRILPLLPALFFGLTPLQPCLSQPLPPPAIAVNQIGFYPDAPKYAVVTRPAAKDVFFIVTVGGNSSSWEERVDTVFIGRLGPVIASGNSSLSTRLADFSVLHKPGTYRVVVPGFPNSYPFTISAGIFSPLTAAVIKGYYYQRSAMALTPAYAGKWSRPAGHPDDHVLVHSSAADARRPEGTIISASGGWYDAGDYNKYIVNSGVTMGTLFDAWEDFPAYFDTLHTNIPPIAGVPDLLNEALYNLRWMLQMQDPADGGVYHKCTNAVFDGMVMPGVTKAPRYVVQKGTAATLDFAAVMAQAARIFTRFSRQLPGLADSCRRAATQAWQWAQRYPDSVYDQNALNRVYRPAITTGAYGDSFFEDERFWAACELWVTTGDAQYYPVVAKHLGDAVALPSWAYVAMMGDLTLLRHMSGGSIGGGPRASGNGQDTLDVLRQRLLHMADTFVRRLKGTAFHTVMGESTQDFVWGSSSVAANQGMVLINAWLQKHDTAYLDAALDNLDYLLGRNATGYCFVTGSGSRSPLHPHHRPSIADSIAPPVPGLLAGGPNPGMQDHQTYNYKERETAYLDNDQAYASNEIAINWNAPLVYLGGAIEALQYKAGYARPGQVAPPPPPPPAQALQPMLHPLTRDRSGLYHGIFPIGGTLAEQILLNTNGTFVYYYVSRGGKADTAVGSYQLVEDKLYLSYKASNSAFPQQFYRRGKKLYRADERGRRVKRMPGVSGRRQFLLFGSRKRKYYLEQ